MRRQKQEIAIDEYMIRRPVYWPVFLSIMLLLSLSGCFLYTPSAQSKDDFDVIAMVFYRIAGFSIWIPICAVVFVLWAVHLYIYFRFKLVIHGSGFSVTPLFGVAHDVAFSAVKRVLHSKRFSNKGYYIEIEYEDKKIHIPYTINRKGGFRQKGIEVLLKRAEAYKTIIIEDKLPV